MSGASSECILFHLGDSTQAKQQIRGLVLLHDKLLVLLARSQSRYPAGASFQTPAEPAPLAHVVLQDHYHRYPKGLRLGHLRTKQSNPNTRLCGCGKMKSHKIYIQYACVSLSECTVYVCVCYIVLYCSHIPCPAFGIFLGSTIFKHPVLQSGLHVTEPAVVEKVDATLAWISFNKLAKYLLLFVVGFVWKRCQGDVTGSPRIASGYLRKCFVQSHHRPSLQHGRDVAPGSDAQLPGLRPPVSTG